MAGVLLAIDLPIVVAGLAAAWPWWAASRDRVRRSSLHEVLDGADINRLVIALNRTQILRARAALATALPAILIALRLLLLRSRRLTKGLARTRATSVQERDQEPSLPPVVTAC